MKNSHLVFIPAPGMGHLVATVEFAKLLIHHDDRLSITVFVIKAPGAPAVDAYTDSLSSLPDLPRGLQLIHLPSSESHQPPPYLFNIMQNNISQVKQAVSDLVQESHSKPDSPRLAAFVVDMFCTAMIDVATELGIPTLVFYTSGAAFLGLMLHLHKLREQGDIDTTAHNFKDSGTEISIPSFPNPIPANVLPNIVLDKDWEASVDDYVKGLRKAKGIIINTFEGLESHAVHSLSDGDITVYPVGPILSVWNDETVQKASDVMEWLDDQPPSSVLFLCFGSRGYFEEDDQVKEIARALERSEVRFLWSLKKPQPKDSRGPISGYSSLEVLPEGFLERTAEIGRVIGWAPQAQILAHPAVGGFISHCGWNSILESIYYGVPIATWPLHSEQQLNAFQLVRELKIGVEISLDYRIKFKNGSKSGVISAERIERGIKEVMEKESETRRKVKQMSELSRMGLREGGSSYSNLSRLIDDILNTT